MKKCTDLSVGALKLFKNLFKVLICAVPSGSFTRLVADGLERRFNDLSCLVQGLDLAESHELCGDVTHRGRLNRAGNDSSARRVSGELADHLILDSAAHKVNNVDFLAEDLFKAFDGIAVFHRKALRYATCDRADSLGNGLICVFAELGNEFRHISGAGKTGVVRIDEAFKRLCVPCCLLHIVKRQRLALSLPLTAALLNDPQTHNVFKEADSLVDTALVGEVVFRGKVVYQGLVDLDA